MKKVECAICEKKIEEGTYCDACAEELDSFFEQATHISGRNYDKERQDPDTAFEFQDDLQAAFRRGAVVFDGKYLKSIGTFETHYKIL